MSPVATVASVLVEEWGAICLSMESLFESCETNMLTCFSQRRDLWKVTPSILSDSCDSTLPAGVVMEVVGMGPAGAVGVKVRIAVLERFNLSLFEAM